MMELLQQLITVVHNDMTATHPTKVVHLYVCDTELQASQARDMLVQTIDPSLIVHQTMFNVLLVGNIEVLFLSLTRTKCRVVGLSINSIFWNCETPWNLAGIEERELLLPRVRHGGKIYE